MSKKLNLSIGFLLGICLSSPLVLAQNEEGITKNREDILDESNLKHPREIQFENSHVKVWKRMIGPKEKIKKVNFPGPQISVPLTDGTLIWTEESGKKIVLERKKGKAYWVPADKIGEFHSLENPTNTPYETMVIQLKNAD